MTADELIDSYVADVVMLLPRRQRRDVAQELRVLLAEEVDAAAAGAESREAAARALLAGFGRPAEVAARYGPPVALIDPADTRSFLTLAVGGTAVILFGAVLGALIDPARPAPQRAVDRAWPTAFAWVGLLAVGFAVAAWARRRRPPAPWKPRAVGGINRTGRVAAIVFFSLGTFVLVDPARVIRAVSGGRAAQPLYDAFVYDGGFLRFRGPVVLSLMIAGIVLQVGLLWRGRWRLGIERVDLGFGLLVCAALTWAVGTGPVFTATETDQTARGAVALIILVSLVDVAVRARRQNARRAVEPAPDQAPRPA